MGKLIDEIEIYKRLRPKVDNETLDEIMLDIPTVDAFPKDQYEVRLKADLEAFLVELKMEIEELRLDRPLFSRGYECYGLEDKTPTEIQQECSDIIQEKINALKGNDIREK